MIWMSSSNTTDEPESSKVSNRSSACVEVASQSLVTRGYGAVPPTAVIGSNSLRSSVSPIDTRKAGNPFIDVLLDPESLRDGLLDADFVRGRVQRFMAGDAISVELWAMINLELWRREFLTGAIRMKAIAS